jgi:hypothetical protein
MRTSVTLATKVEVVQVIAKRYRAAGRADKQKILGELRKSPASSAGTRLGACAEKALVLRGAAPPKISVGQQAYHRCGSETGLCDATASKISPKVIVS